ncbi:unnamed protein product [Phaedon cochleariae]|uniref:C2H2-type domain-containing protein n=1 Tax=Phaedon cochleariae TaxID=80249 RepID=A0A9N9S8K3_PHACE|nr:unnamed protein product [Phaedon cochleariae]
MEETEGIKRKNRMAVFEHVVEEDKNPKRKKLDDSESESELVIDERQKKKRNKKKPRKKLSEEPLKLQCNWNSCGECFKSWESFNTHLMDHATEDLVHFKCLWLNCSHKSCMIPLLMQHLSYHGYIAKLQNIGKNIVERNKLPECTQKEVCKIPVFPNGYTCEWSKCSHNFCTVYEFFNHMAAHVKNNPTFTEENSGQIMYCYWKGCNIKLSKQVKLTEHLRSHTKEKIIGCPTCSTVFSSKTKFCDHRKRQISMELQTYQCSQCLKLFPTERLLRDHMRSHINHYKCTMCDMTCPKPSVLAKHIRFKHVKDKPYKCTECDKSFVAKHNLNTHMVTHYDEDPMSCDHCDFTCRTTKGLENHYIKKHENVDLILIYECHCCKKKFKRGDYLTKHLTKLHNYHWPSGHTRFRYRKDEDGIYRLQTVRYESLEVTQEMIRSEAMPANNVMPGVSYNLKYDNDGKSGYVLSISATGEQSVNVQSEKEHRDNLLITINDVDEEGNILNSRVVESSIGKVVTIAESANDENDVKINVEDHMEIIDNNVEINCKTEKINNSETAQINNCETAQINNCETEDQSNCETEEINNFETAQISNCDIEKQ